MPQSQWDNKIGHLQELIMKPVQFNDMQVTLIDAVHAYHDCGWIAEDHRHPWYEFNYVSSGSLRTSSQNVSFLTCPGEFFLIPPGVTHKNQNPGSEPDDGFCLRWQLEQLALAEDQPEIGRPYQQVARVLNTFRPCSSGSESITAANESLLAARGLFSLQVALLGWIFKLYELWSDETSIPMHNQSRNELLVRQAVLYLEEYYASHFSVGDLANSLNVSYRQLARIFRQITGVTVIERLNDIRMNQAKILLLNTDKTIKEIALLVGFENEFYFSSMFSQHNYLTPSDFRKKILQGHD